ncbi:peptidoglycan DD-metalloendopeptidase family protein [Rhodococcus sp. NPDC056960]|uniref:peptidoglycan DD-metalloendopeptidase family protein n=1 Tax=Rhodococcus sp. NPDC056960 TaxID=3345982 RepID=UPI00363CDE14
MGDAPSSSNTGIKATAAVLAAVVVMAGFLVLGSDNPPTPTDCVPTRSATPGPTGAVRMPAAEGQYELSSPFGPRWGTFHQGVDFAGPAGTPIYAAADGVVTAAGPATGFGNWIVLDSEIDGGKVSTVYGHMYDDGVLVKTGEKVTAGQHIAAMGSNGESTGSHLHFEVWPGGRLSGGTAIDPMPWLASHGASAAPTPAAPAPPAPQVRLAAASDTEMAALSATKGSEAHWQVDTVRVARAVAATFPEVDTIGGWRPADTFPDHPSGRAADIMIPNWDTPGGKALGDAVADYVMANKDLFHVQYIIWRQQYRPAAGEGNLMEDRGSPTQNHFDHVHVTLDGHGFPAPGQLYGAVPGGPPAPAPTTGPCAGAPAPRSGGGMLRPGSVPPAFEPWIIRAAATCPQVPAPIIAAQIENESQFDVGAHNAGSGADGPTQFLPGTWAAKAVDGDGDGRKDTRSIPDAVMTQAAYDCELADIAAEMLAAGQIRGDLTELYLSMYNCGPGATARQGGVCQNAETLAYVKNIPRRAASAFAADLPTAA